ncbi:hypothetical protein F4804DRAFT_135542 [Jackrogersella minutella]|nr:hypothetical protein F4804DRAFT_135542 [Jackrogersella minutella]
MVYCGKPSKGCQMCRTRRIKCDETKPTCNQCTKSRRQCPGYKDEFDLMFRNETQATERRARRASKKGPVRKIAKSDSDYPLRDFKVFPTFADSIKSQLVHAVAPSLNVPVEHQASCHFVSHFVLTPPEGNTRGFLDFIVPLLKQDLHGHLQQAFKACSVAFLNNRGGMGGRFSDKALHEYTKALNGTNAALRDPEVQLADSTLAAVLLLGLFESITAKQIGMLNWGSHTEGAIQLVQARGRKQLKTKVGLMLFIAVRTQMIIHSLTSGTTPIMGTEWWIDDAIRDGTATKCHRLMIQTGQLRAEVTRLMNSAPRSPANIEVMQRTIVRLQALDRDVVAWMRGVPAEWQFRTAAWEDCTVGGDLARADAFPGRIDVYRDFYIASVWNTARTARLVLMSLVVRCAARACAPGDHRTTPEYFAAARTCVDTIADVIASVPYHLGWHLKPENRRKVLREHGDGFARGEGDCPKALAGYFLTWPLACLNSQDYTTDAQRAWVQGRLSFIGDELGVKYAHILKPLQIRIPSMLIRRDGLMAGPYGAAQDFLRLVGERKTAQVQQSARQQGVGEIQQEARGVREMGAHAYAAPPLGGAGGDDNPLRHVQALQKERFELHRAELLARAAGGTDAGEGAKWVARRWLVV